MNMYFITRHSFPYIYLRFHIGLRKVNLNRLKEESTLCASFVANVTLETMSSLPTCESDMKSASCVNGVALEISSMSFIGEFRLLLIGMVSFKDYNSMVSAHTMQY